MPKETVHYGQKYLIVDKVGVSGSNYWEEQKFEGYPVNSEGVEDFPEGTSYAESPSVEILWSKPGDPNAAPIGEEQHGHVHLAIKVNKNEFEYHKKGIMAEDDDTFRIFTRGLTRRQINDMIKVLRRARDMAHGSDE